MRINVYKGRTEDKRWLRTTDPMTESVELELRWTEAYTKIQGGLKSLTLLLYSEMTELN